MIRRRGRALGVLGFVLSPSFVLASLVAFETRSVVVHFWDLYSLLDSSVLVTSRFWVASAFLFLFRLLFSLVSALSLIA